MAFSDIFAQYRQIAADGFGISGIFTGLFKACTGFIYEDLPRMATKKYKELTNYHDDNYVIPSDAKTLIGDDIKSLYEDLTITEKQVATSDDKFISIIEPSGKYRTEMYDIVTSEWTSYDLCNDITKTAYELTLLTKKYGNRMLSDPNNNDSILKECNDKINQYKDYCDSHNIEWDFICQKVSIELQVESAEYKRIGSKTDQRIANMAHTLIVDNMSDVSKEIFPIKLTGSITQEETFDISENLEKTPVKETNNTSTGFHPVNGLLSYAQSFFSSLEQANGIDRANENIPVVSQQTSVDEPIDYK